MVRDFVLDVLAYTGRSQVDLVTHSMGVTVGFHGVEFGALWNRVRRFVAIGGGLRGLASCWYAGNANPWVPACGSQNLFDSQIFGFFPHTWTTWNPRMGRLLERAGSARRGRR